MPTSSDTWTTLENRFQLPTYAKMPISVERGQGCYVYDTEGREFLDLYGGHAVVSTGHCHPRIVAALQEQAARLIFYSNATYNSLRGRAVARLMEFSAPFYQAFLVNSGAEANENAIKLARAVTGRREVLSLQGSFHGRNYGSLSATGIDRYRNYLNTPVPHHRILPATEVAGAVSSRTAAVLVEPIQSMGGLVEIPRSVLQDLARACQDQGALLIFDEIQTGVGRTGRFLYTQKVELPVDMVTLAKGIASGFPAGALLVTEAVAKQVRNGDLGTTFGGGPLACAALLATLEVMEEEKLIDNAGRQGDYLRRHLSGLEGVEEVRGQGLLLGICFRERTAAEVQKHLMEHRIMAGTSHDPRVLRLMPPLTLQQAEADRLLEVLRQL